MIAFFLLALAALVSALVVVTHRNPVICAMALAFHLVAIAGLYFLLDAEFLALLQVIVYAGAILVLIVFVIMLLNLPDEMKGKSSGALQKPIGACLAALFGLLLIRTVLTTRGRFTPVPSGFGSVESVGRSLCYGEFFYYPFEVISLLLIVAMVGAVLLAKRKL